MSRRMLRVSPKEVPPLYIMSYRIFHILDATVAGNNREDSREVGEKQIRNVVGSEDGFVPMLQRMKTIPNSGTTREVRAEKETTPKPP